MLFKKNKALSSLNPKIIKNNQSNILYFFLLSITPIIIN